MRLGRPSCSGSPFFADWTGYAGWIGGVVSRASACSLAALDQLPAADRRKLVGKNRRRERFFFSFGRRASAVITCQQPAPGVQANIPHPHTTTFWLLETLNTMQILATGVISVDVMSCGPDSCSNDKLWGCTPCMSIGQRPTA